MPLYTFESPRSISRIGGQRVVVDTSYLIDLTNPTMPLHATVVNFHAQARSANTLFFINVTVRQEFLKILRRALIIDSMIALAQQDPNLERLYRTRAGNKPLSALTLKSQCDNLYKDHVKRGDVNRLIAGFQQNLWQTVVDNENDNDIVYYSPPGKVSWDDLGIMMQKYGLSPTDAMITNYAITINAAAIVTSDGDYAQLTRDIDVYMPIKSAQQYTSYYNPSID